MTGKYNDGNLPPGSRFDSDPFTKAFAAMYYGSDKEKMTENLNEVGKIAEELGCTQAQLALAWVIVNWDVSTAIFGASWPEQVVDNFGALEVAKKWTPEIEAKMEAALKNAPPQEMLMSTMGPEPKWRDSSVNYEFAKEFKNLFLLNPPEDLKEKTAKEYKKE